MTLTRPTLLIACALVCFVVAFMLAIHALTGGNLAAWTTAGFVFFTAAHLP